MNQTQIKRELKARQHATALQTGTPITTATAAYRVKHTDDTEAPYHGDELTAVRERATEAAAPSPEQTRLDELEARVNRLVGEAEQTRDAVARDLAGFEAQLEHYWDRLRALEQQPRRHPEPVHDDVTLDVRPSELSALRGLRRAVEQWWSKRNAGYEPGCELTKEEAAVDNALFVLIELDDDGSLDEIPEVPAPPPSDACREIEQLREELAELRRRDDDWRRRCEGGAELRRRVCQALHVTEDSMLIGELADLVRLRCQVYDHLADPEAYDEPDPDTLAATALVARVIEKKQAGLLSDLRNILAGSEAGETEESLPLPLLAMRAKLRARPVGQLLKCYSTAEIDGFRGGLVSMVAGPEHCVGRGVADMLGEIVAIGRAATGTA